MYFLYLGVPLLAKIVLRDAFSFDEVVNISEAPYIVDYTGLPSLAETDAPRKSRSSERKIWLALTLAVMSVICGGFWTGTALLVLQWLHS